MNTCLNCGKMKHSAVMQTCTCQYSMQAPPAAEQEPVETYIHEFTKLPHPNDFGIPKGHWWQAKQYADALYTAPAQPAQEPTDIAALVQGMEVSIDVSTGDHDAGHRLFGTVTLVQESQKSKHGLILLVQDPQPNFKAQRKPWVNLTDDEIQAVAKQARSKDHAVTLTNKFLREKNL